MICPACDSHLSEKKYCGCPLRFCTGCDGIWVEKALFARLGNIISFDIQQPEDRTIELFKPRHVKQPNRNASGKICPACSTAMKEFNYAYDSNIILDRCLSCHGIWADAGEMIEVAKFLKMDPELHAIARSLTDKPYLKQMDDDQEKLAFVFRIALTVLRILIFRH